MNLRRLVGWLRGAWARLGAPPPTFSAQLDRALADEQRVTLRLAALERSLDASRPARPVQTTPG